MEYALRETERMIQRIAESVPELIFIYDIELKRCVYRNRSLMEGLGYAPPGSAGMLTMEELLSVTHPEDVPKLTEHFGIVRRSPTDHIHELQIRLQDAQGETRWRGVRSMVFNRDAGGVATQILGSSQDITDLKRSELRLQEQMSELETARAELERRHEELIRLNEQLGELATRDGLTEVFNHRALQEKLAAEVARSRRYRKPLALIMCDVDDFKAYNDRFGHPAGDRRLKEFVQTICTEVRVEDFVARYGGEEFVIALPNTAILEAHTIAQRILIKLNAVPSEQRITASFGCAELCLESGSPEQLVRDADRGLYLAKQEGKNRIRIYG